MGNDCKEAFVSEGLHRLAAHPGEKVSLAGEGRVVSAPKGKAPDPLLTALVESVSS